MSRRKLFFQFPSLLEEATQFAGAVVLYAMLHLLAIESHGLSTANQLRTVSTAISGNAVASAEWQSKRHERYLPEKNRYCLSGVFVLVHIVVVVVVVVVVVLVVQ